VKGESEGWWTDGSRAVECGLKRGRVKRGRVRELKVRGGGMKGDGRRHVGRRVSRLKGGSEGWASDGI
jgi:hypothetical protein